MTSTRTGDAGPRAAGPGGPATAPSPDVALGTSQGTWRDRAACLDADPDLFFPVGTTGPALRQVAEAKAICQACPVREPCLAWALGQGILGVWGGTTEDERRAIRGAAPHGHGRAGQAIQTPDRRRR